MRAWVHVQVVIVPVEGEAITGTPCELVLSNGSRMIVDVSTRWQAIEASLPRPQRIDRDRDEEECIYWIALDRHAPPDDCIRRLNHYID